VPDARWRASNYLTIGQIYLLANPLLRAAVVGAHQAPSARTLGYACGRSFRQFLTWRYPEHTFP